MILNNYDFSNACVCICFICCIIIGGFIIYYIVNYIDSKYIYKHLNNNNKVISKFEDITQSTSSYQMSQNDIKNSLQPLQTILTKYSNLDIPIAIANNNTICNPWGIFQNNKFLTRDNVCIAIDNSSGVGGVSGGSVRQCLTGISNQLTSCDNFYSNSKLTNANIIHTENLMNSATSKLISGMNTLSSLMAQNTSDLANNVNNAVRYNKILAQQSSLIDKNDIAMEDKRKINDNKNTEMDIKANQAGINYDKFNQFLENNNITINKLSLYKKIIYGLICIIIIVLFINYLISKTL